MADTLIDYSLLVSQLSRSKLQATNPSAYQTINSLIGGVQSFQDFVQTGFSDQAQQQSAFAKSINDTLTQMAKDIANLQQQITDLVNAGPANSIWLEEVPAGFGILGVDLPTAFANSQATWMVVKDTTGQAGAYPFTIFGTVDGVTNPVINTAWGFMRVYEAGDGSFHQW